jgi:endonuclease/exonuclease/phosphatase family metal-dependent hydrolase
VGGRSWSAPERAVDLIEEGIMKLKTILSRVLIGLVVLILIGVGLVWFTTYHPAAVQDEAVACQSDAPALRAGQAVKVMTWNVQFMAGKKYTFWFDVPNNDGPDERPSGEAVTATLKEMARVIRAEDPDLVYLQEVDKGAARTDYRDELAELLAMVPGYPCQVQSYYWKTTYVPHPRIHGAMALTLVTLSKYRIAAATRYQLALPPADPLTQQLGLKRAILEARLPVTGGTDFYALNTHLDAFAQGNNTMELQVQEVDARLSALDGTNSAWVIGGDFNLLPPDEAAYKRLAVSHQSYYNPQPEIKLLYDRHSVIPSLADVTGPDFARWFTYLPNDPTIPYLDRTLDYLFYAKTLTPGQARVRTEDTQAISDHEPLIATFTLP